MLPFSAKKIYVDPAVRKTPNCRRRLDRMLRHIQCEEVTDLDPAAYVELLSVRKRRHGKDDFEDDAILAFIPFDEDRTRWYYHLRSGPDYFKRYGGYCQTALELNLVDGCVYRCAYCGFGRRVIFSLDVERLIGGLDEQFALCPEQRLYKFSNMTDLPPFEPELDAARPMVERFSREEHRYLMLFTKSDRIDFLLDLEHHGMTIVSWSLSCDTASRMVEKRTPTLRERIAAMRKVREAGYRVRARLSPIVPVKRWREEYEDLFDQLFRAVRPDIVTLELLGWLDFEDLIQIIPEDLLDPEAVDSARQAADSLRGELRGPFTEAFHQEVYRFCIEAVKRLSPMTPVAVCHGTPPTWDALGRLMGMRPTDYICNCGPTSTPGNPLYRTDGLDPKATKTRRKGT